jgi:hypothetical protein
MRPEQLPETRHAIGEHAHSKYRLTRPTVTFAGAWPRASAKAHNFTNLSADDLIDLAIHGRRWLKSL